MSGRFNEPRLMGNCENCYYAVDAAYSMGDGYPEGKLFYCHRYPEAIEKRRGGYCGEFAWRDGASLLKEAI